MGANKQSKTEMPVINEQQQEELFAAVMAGNLGEYAKTDEGRKVLPAAADQINTCLKSRKAIIGRTMHYLENENKFTAEATSGLRGAGYVLTSISLVSYAIKGVKFVRDWLAPLS